MAVTTITTHPVFLNGEWRDTGAWFDVVSPFSHTVIGRVGRATRNDVEAAIAASSAALANPLPRWQRADILDRVSRLILENREELATAICLEAGKPMKAATAEVARAANTYALSAGEARRLTGHVVPIDGTESGDGHLAWTVRVPIGVIGAISPFNFPLNLVSHKLAPALAAGCPVVLKPASQTPLSALKLAALCEQAALPPGWLHVLPGDAREIGDALVKDDRVAMITFTGSAEVGWGLRARAPRKKVALELGNASPVIVAADADLDLAAAKVSLHAFSYAGQTCVSVQRVYVDRKVMDEFAARLLPRVRALVVGDPEDPSTDVGPVIDVQSHDRILSWIKEAEDGGARVLVGGSDVEGLIGPTVLADVAPDMKVCRQEVFGPICSLASFDTLDEAFGLANDTEYGLQSSVFTASIDTAMKAARSLQFGSVMINEAPEWRVDQMPYGGTKASGNTKEGPAYTIREMSEERLVVLGQAVR